MQRKPTRQSRGANSDEKRYMRWIKERGICVVCDNDGGVIAHHCVGSTYKVHMGVEPVQIGHAFVIGLCGACDNIVTRGSHKKFREMFGLESEFWQKQYKDSPVKFEKNVIEGIMNCGR